VKLGGAGHDIELATRLVDPAKHMESPETMHDDNQLSL
jgi:hypothetical protein